MKHRWLGILTTTALVAGLFGTAAPAVMASSGSPGDNSIVITINDSEAGGSYDQTFVKAYEGTTASLTDVYVYVPDGTHLDGTSEAGVASLDPAFDHNLGDGFDPCADNDVANYLITQDQIDALGDELVDQIVAVDEAHYGGIGLADPVDPASDALVTLVYNVQDTAYYDCAETTYTAGYFAPEYINDAGMNVIVIDAYDWANRVGDQTGNPVGRSYLYEGVIAHELEHLLQNYSDPGELSWVDEGLADFAIFLNNYPWGGSHITYQQVFHRETSLTRWGGGLENYGASFSFFLYLWEQAGGNGGGDYDPDLTYGGDYGDLLIKRIFEEPADGMVGVQNAIDTFNGETGMSLRSAEELFKDWAVAIYLDYEGSDTFDFRNLDFGDPLTTRWTVEIANDVFWGGRGIYTGAMPSPRWVLNRNVPTQTALPFGVSYETFRNPGPTFRLSFDGDEETVVAPHSGDMHWYGGYESQSDKILNVADGAYGDLTIDFWTWYFIEEGWDYGFVEALVGADWVTVPLEDDSATTVTTNDDPHDNNTEGNGLTGTSGGAYFVDDPVYIHVSGVLPTGTTDVRFRYSTDAAYLDTGWFVDDVNIDGSPVGLSSDDWTLTTGIQENHWVVQVVSSCDLTPKIQGDEVEDAAGFIYRFEEASFTANFSTQCLTKKDRFLVVISNLPTGDLQYLDANYAFRLTNTGNRQN